MQTRRLLKEEAAEVNVTKRWESTAPRAIFGESGMRSINQRVTRGELTSL